MKLKNYLPLVAFCVMSTGWNSEMNAQLAPGVDFNNLDKNALPGTSFYQYACGGWMEKNPLTGEYSRFGSFDKLAENNREQLKGLIEGLASTKNQSGTVAQKIGDLYNIAMDSAKLNKEGAAPIKPYLKKIASIKGKSAIYPLIAEMRKMGLDPFFTVYVSADDMNSSMNMIHTYQSGISMGEREYYLDNDDKTKVIRDKYKLHVAKMFRLAGFDKASADKAMASVMLIETRLAKAARTKVELRDRSLLPPSSKPDFEINGFGVAYTAPSFLAAAIFF